MTGSETLQGPENENVCVIYIAHARQRLYSPRSLCALHAKLTQNSEGRVVVLWFSMFRCSPDRGNTPRTTSWPRIAEFSSLQTATTPKHLDVLDIWHGLKIAV